MYNCAHCNLTTLLTLSSHSASSTLRPALGKIDAHTHNIDHVQYPRPCLPIAGNLALWPMEFRSLRQPTASNLGPFKVVAFFSLVVFPDPMSTPLASVDTDILVPSAGREVGASITARLLRDAFPAVVDADVVGVPCNVVLRVVVLPESLHEVEGGLVIRTITLAAAASDGYVAHISAFADINIYDIRLNAGRLGVERLVNG